MNKQCVNCPGAVDHSTEECPIRATFETYMLGREHPVIGWIDSHWFRRGDDPATYANDYVQGCWVMWHTHRQAEQVPEQAPSNQSIAALIVSDVCDLDPEDDGPDCVRINVHDLLRICERHTQATSLPPAVTDELTAVRCQCCTAEHPHNSYDAGFIAGSGMCQVCDAAIPAKEIHTPAARDVLAERQRQITAEGYDSSNDDMATRGQLAIAAGCYAIWSGHPALMGTFSWKSFFPWDWKYWKPSTPRHNLIKAGALILAEIERLDRAEQAKQQEQQ